MALESSESHLPFNNLLVRQAGSLFDTVKGRPVHAPQFGIVLCGVCRHFLECFKNECLSLESWLRTSRLTFFRDSGRFALLRLRDTVQVCIVRLSVCN